MVHYIDIFITMQRRISIASTAAEIGIPAVKNVEFFLRIFAFFNTIKHSLLWTITDRKLRRKMNELGQNGATAVS